MVQSFGNKRRLLSQESDDLFTPSLPLAIFLIFISRAIAAKYSLISDCDETFNYWEPLHLLSFPSYDKQRSDPSFQTWENSPEFAIRSWAYLLPYSDVVALVRFLGGSKIKSFISVRLYLGLSSAITEALLYRTAVQVVSPRVGRYLLFILITSAGMYTASTALLPSTFTMYTATLAMSFALYPSSLSSDSNLKSTWKGSKGLIPSMSLPQTISNRTFAATLIFATGALVGWPFSIILSFPFVYEELFLSSGDVDLLSRSGFSFSLFTSRFKRFFLSALSSALFILPYLISIDSIAYGKFTLVPLNIISYNLLSSKRGVGPELYGTEPWWFYGANLTLAFNILLPLAALSAPLVTILWLLSSFDPDLKDTKGKKSSSPKDGSSPFLLLLVRLAPAYLWVGLLSLQPHKEERFIFPAYTLICFNAAVGLSSLRSLVEKLYQSIHRQSSTPSSSRPRSRLLPSFISSLTITPVLLITSIISILRIMALSSYYKAPIQVLQDLHSIEIGPNQSGPDPSDQKVICYGQEWYRFPSNFFLPEGVRAEFIKSGFDGILPSHFGWKREQKPGGSLGKEQVDEGDGERDSLVEKMDWISNLVGLEWKRREETRALGGSFNDQNREETDRYIPLSDCHYLVHLSFPSREAGNQSPPPKDFKPISCHPFLDSSSSRPSQSSSGTSKIKSNLARILWLPGEGWRRENQWGDYCLLGRDDGSILDGQIQT